MKIAIIQYSTYGHVTKIAKSIKEGVETTGAAEKVDIFQVHETLSDEVLQLIHAPEKPTDIPEATTETLKEYDAFLFGIPTRYGNIPSQLSSLLDSTGSLWATGALIGKPVGVFVSTGTPGGGQEVTIRNFLSYLVHQGMIYVPLGYGKAFPLLTNLEEPHGSSPWGAGTYAGGDGSRQSSELELKIAKIHGETFATTAVKFVGSAETSSAETKEDLGDKPKTVEKAEDKKEVRGKQSNNQKDTEKSGCGVKCLIM